MFTILDKCSILYYAGNLSKKFMCEQCQKCLLKLNKKLDDKDHLLIVHKTFKHIELISHSGLKTPIENLKKLIKIIVI